MANPKIILNIRMDPALYDRLRDYAESRGISMTLAANSFIEQGLRLDQKNTTFTRGI